MCGDFKGFDRQEHDRLFEGRLLLIVPLQLVPAHHCDIEARRPRYQAAVRFNTSVDSLGLSGRDTLFRAISDGFVACAPVRALS